jgi:hypothetical protein
LKELQTGLPENPTSRNLHHQDRRLANLKNNITNIVHTYTLVQ